MAESDDEDFAALFAASEGKRTRERRVAAGDVVRGRAIAVGATSAFAIHAPCASRLVQAPCLLGRRSRSREGGAAGPP